MMFYTPITCSVYASCILPFDSIECTMILFITQQVLQCTFCNIKTKKTDECIPQFSSLLFCCCCPFLNSDHFGWRRSFWKRIGLLHCEVFKYASKSAAHSLALLIDFSFICYFPVYFTYGQILSIPKVSSVHSSDSYTYAMHTVFLIQSLVVLSEISHSNVSRM